MKLEEHQIDRLRALGAWRLLAEITGVTKEYAARVCVTGAHKNPSCRQGMVLHAALGLLAFVDESKKTANPFNALLQR